MATLKIQPMVVSFQSSLAGWSMPMSVDNGRLKTLNAYACPMERWMASAAGGMRHRS